MDVVNVGAGGSAMLRRQFPTPPAGPRVAAVTATHIRADVVSGRRELAADPAYVDGVLADGNARAGEVADATLTRVREVMGMRYV